MSKLYVSEYGNAAGRPPLAQEPSILDQPALNFAGGAVQSAAFTENTQMVRVHTDAICSIAFGKSPTATTDSKRMVADQTEYFMVRPGDKLSVIPNV